MRTSIVIIIIIVAASLSMKAWPVFAVGTTTSIETFTPEVPLPGVFQGPQNADDTLLSHYIQAIFIYFIWTVGVLATVMVIYGGIRWVSAAGNPGQIKEARDIIDNAIIGVIIGLTSVVLLNIINPKLAQLSIPKLNSITKINFVGSHISAICPAALNVECNKLYTTGQVKVGQDTVTDYCIGTKKDASFHGDTWVCQLTKTPDNQLYVSGVLLPSIPIYKADPTKPTDPKINGLDSLTVVNNIQCGVVNHPLFGGAPAVGLHDGTSQQKVGFCYLDGIYGVYDPVKDIITNMCWPGTTCPVK